MTGYFDELCREVGIDGSKGYQYRRLAAWLMDEPFYSEIKGDDSRANEAIRMRDGYSDAPSGACRVMEILVSLSREMRDISDGIVANNGQENWFYVLIGNLGLLPLDDISWHKNPEDCAIIARQNVRNWLDRNIDFDGTGGIFPLKDPHQDQAKAEIWYQMNAFLMEEMGEKL